MDGKPLLNKGFFILACISLAIACKHKDAATPEIKIAKTIPLNFVAAGDSMLHVHQDTVYFGKAFFTGYEYALHPNGDTAFIHGYFNGVEEGPQQNWYDNRQPAEQRFYINGKKEGLQQGWWPNGNKRFVYTAESDAYTGELKEWNSKGYLYKLFHYVNGSEEGSERMWWEDSTVRANYVVRNGKKYGLIGIKLCINPNDSVTEK